jgi:putative peptide zinc metalloprotease protein
VVDQESALPGLSAGALVLVLPDGSRVSVQGPLTIGRGAEATVRIDDRTVSRMHARISPTPGGPVIEDAGSRFGTQLGGVTLTAATPLRPGADIRVGDAVIRVESATPRPVAASGTPLGDVPRGPGETLVVPVDATLLGLRSAPANYDGALRPRVRSGWALKRLGEEEGEDRFVLRDLRSQSFLRIDAADAALFELLDGGRSVTELLSEAERIIGPSGPGHLVRLIANLADRGLIDGIGAAAAPAPVESRMQRLFKPRDRTADWPADYFERAYHHWGRAFFSPLSLSFLVLFALAGFGVFTYLIGARYGTPFVVAHRLVIGGAVFVAGRFLLVAVHELAHGLALAHYGRRAVRCGLRLVLIFPYAFVDTSEAHLEPRGHRIAIGAAGPACDLTLGSVFSVACALSPPGSLRDVLFQLAFGAYIGGFFNLNPFLDRDGYTILVDFLREPGLRVRARRQLSQRLSGAGADEQTSPVLARYAVAGVIWSVLGAGFAILFSERYYHRLSALAPHGFVLTAFIIFYVVLFIPVIVQLGLPLVRRARFGSSEVNRVVR